MEDYDGEFPPLSPNKEQDEGGELPAIFVTPRRQGTRKSRPMTGVSDRCGV